MTTVATALGGFIIYYLFIMNPLENVFYRMITGDTNKAGPETLDLLQKLNGFSYKYEVTTYDDIVKRFGNKFYFHATLRVPNKFSYEGKTYYYNKKAVYGYLGTKQTVSNPRFTAYFNDVYVYAQFYFNNDILVFHLIDHRKQESAGAERKGEFNTQKEELKDSFCIAMHYRWFTLVDSSAVISNCDFFKNRKAYWSDPELDWRKYFTSKRSLAPAYICNGKFINTCWFWRWLDSPDEAADPYGTYKVKKPIAIADLDLEWNQINSLRKNE